MVTSPYENMAQTPENEQGGSPHFVDGYGNGSTVGGGRHASGLPHALAHVPGKFGAVDDLGIFRHRLGEPAQGIAATGPGRGRIGWTGEALHETAGELRAFRVRQLEGFIAEAFDDPAGHGMHPEIGSATNLAPVLQRGYPGNCGVPTVSELPGAGSQVRSFQTANLRPGTQSSYWVAPLCASMYARSRAFMRDW